MVPGRDFVTATVSAPLLRQARRRGMHHDPGCAGACRVRFRRDWLERGAGILDGVAHPLPQASARRVGVGETLELSGPLVVFSNELLDALPLRRFRRRGGAWRVLGGSGGPGGLAEVELDGDRSGPARAPDGRPVQGYSLDAPSAAAALARNIAGQPWFGLFPALGLWQAMGRARPFDSFGDGPRSARGSIPSETTCWPSQASRISPATSAGIGSKRRSAVPMDSLVRGSSHRRLSSRGTPGDSSSLSLPRRPRG